MRKYTAIATEDHNFHDGEENELVKMNVWGQEGWGEFTSERLSPLTQVLEPYEYRVEEL